jgi:hypothetical protein
MCEAIEESPRLTRRQLLRGALIQSSGAVQRSRAAVSACFVNGLVR